MVITKKDIQWSALSGSDGRSAVRCWPVEQEVTLSNPTHGRNYCLSGVRSLGLFKPFSKMSAGFRWPGSFIELGVKVRFYILRWLAVISDCTSARVENDIRRDRYKLYTLGHRIIMPTSPAQHTCDYLDNVCRVGHEATSNTNHQWLLRLENAQLALQEKWNNWPHPYLLASAERTKHERTTENYTRRLDHRDLRAEY